MSGKTGRLPTKGPWEVLEIPGLPELFIQNEETQQEVCKVRLPSDKSKTDDEELARANASFIAWLANEYYKKQEETLWSKDKVYPSMQAELKLLMQRCNQISSEHDFWDDYPDVEEGRNYYFISTKLLLVCSEIVEAAEALRDGKIHMDSGKGNFCEEIADSLIRIFDLCEGTGLSEQVITALDRKMKVNEGRPHKHGRKF